jgi:hypothetical protein
LAANKGFTVLASDATDFDKGGDANSYAACLAAIKTADHFLLLIGERCGGIYEDGSDPISITRAEYREAFRESQRRHLPIHAFVRKRTWNEKLLYEIGRLAPTDDLRHQVAFLREVGRVAEMKEAISGQRDRPPNNWIHQFETFSDIRSALEVNLGLHHDLETDALRKAVAFELEFLIAHFLRKTPGGKCSWRSELTRYLGEKIQIPVSRLSQSLELSREDVSRLALLPRLSVFPQMQALERASYWCRFAEHDPIEGSTKMSPLQNSIRRVLYLLKRLQLFEKAVIEARDSLLGTLMNTKGMDASVLLSVPTLYVERILSYSLDLDRLQRRLVSLGAFFILGLEHLDLGEDGIARSPIEGQEKGLQEEEVLPTDVHSYLSRILRSG